MKFVKKSLFRKLIVTLLLFLVLISIFGLFFLYFNQDSVPYVFLLSSLFLFLILFLFVYWWDVIRPLKLVVVEMQALLSGSEYKNIFSTRVDEIGVLAFFFNQVVKSLGKVSFDIKDRERMLEELNIASQLQRDILPIKTPVIPGLHVVAKNRPASEVGGDSFNIFPSEDKTYIYIGDVTGHGVAAGLIMTMVNSLISVFAESSKSAYEIVVNVNKHIKKHIKKAMFMTMVILSWDHKEQKLSYVGAGHEHILVYRKSSGVVETILSGGVALGMVPDNAGLVKEKEIKLNEGDLVILYTDGITEARNDAEELYEIDRLIKAVKTYGAEYSADGVNYRIAKDVSSFMQNHSQLDDMTLIVIQKDSEGKLQKDVEKATNWDLSSE